jgi:phosphoglycerate dehydrogenase-like enzyme
MAEPRTSLRVVLPGGSAAGAPWLKERLPGADLVFVSDANRAEIQQALQDADAVVVGGELTREDTAKATRLRLVHVLGAGWDGIADDALPRGCLLCNVYEHETAIGEWVLMGMLALARRLLVYDRDLRRGEWHEAYSFGGTPERDLRGRTVGVLGLGHIGGRVAALARGIGMRVIGVTREPSDERAALHGLDWLGDSSDLQRLLDESDFAVVCVPLTEETRGLIGAPELKRLGPDSYLVNVSRGPIVSEGPLYAALRDGTIAGAALDVWYRYPSGRGDRVLPASFPFWDLDNVVMTPHSSGWSESTLAGRWRFIAEQLARLQDGQALKNVIRQAS